MAVVTSLDTAIAPVGHGRFITSVVSFIRPNNATAYAANDVISDSASVTGVLRFPQCTRSGAVVGVTLTNRLETDTITPRLHLFDAEPTNIIDGGPLALVASDIPKLLGFIDFVDADKGLVGTLTNCYVPQAGGSHLNGKLGYTNATGSLFGLLTSVPGYTPIALTQWTIKLHLEID